MVHSFLELVPLTGLALLATLHWSQAGALVPGSGAPPRDARRLIGQPRSATVEQTPARRAPLSRDAPRRGSRLGVGLARGGAGGAGSLNPPAT